MELNSGRVRQMVDEARAGEGAIVCHATLESGEHAVCRGFVDRYATQPLQIAERLDMFELVDPDSLRRHPSRESS